MKTIFLFIITLACCANNSSVNKSKYNSRFTNREHILYSSYEIGRKSDSFYQYKRMINEVSKISEQIQTESDNYNNSIYFLIDMRIASNYNRFFVFDKSTNKIIKSALVAHGCGSQTNRPDSLYFSNIPDSKCTSLGKYKIGVSYVGSFGKSYRLHGLDPTNSKAYERAIVLHAFSSLPSHETNYAISNSYGCPMVNPQFFQEIAKIIDQSEKPIVLSIYY